MNFCEDYDLWLRMLQMTQGANIPETLVTYRVRSMSTTSKNLYRMKWQTLKLIWQYRSYFPKAYRAILFKLITFPLDTSRLLKIWKRWKA